MWVRILRSGVGTTILTVLTAFHIRIELCMYNDVMICDIHIRDYILKEYTIYKSLDKCYINIAIFLPVPRV